MSHLVYDDKPRLISLEELETVLKNATYNTYKYTPDIGGLVKTSKVDEKTFDLRLYLRQINVPIDRLTIFFIPGGTYDYGEIDFSIPVHKENRGDYFLIATIYLGYRDMSLFVAPFMSTIWQNTKVWGHHSWNQFPRATWKFKRVSVAGKSTVVPDVTMFTLNKFTPTCLNHIRLGVLEEYRSQRLISDDQAFAEVSDGSYLDYPTWNETWNAHYKKIYLDSKYDNDFRRSEVEKIEIERLREEHWGNWGYSG